MKRMRNRIFPDDDIFFIALVKNGERYVFSYDLAHRVDALQTMGRWASNPELSFTWGDAAGLSLKVKRASTIAREEDNEDT